MLECTNILSRPLNQNVAMLSQEQSENMEKSLSVSMFLKKLIATFPTSEKFIGFHITILRAQISVIT